MLDDYQMTERDIAGPEKLFSACSRRLEQFNFETALLMRKRQLAQYGLDYDKKDIFGRMPTLVL